MNGMGTTVKQVNLLKIKQGVDGIYRIYPTDKQTRFTNIGEFGTLREAIEFCNKHETKES